VSLTSAHVDFGLNGEVFEGVITFPVAFGFVSRRRVQAKID
jgi:hypothetical protein